MTRRDAFTALAAAASIARPALSQRPAAATASPETPPRKPVRTMPLLCAFSQNLARVHYPELGSIAAQIGYEGVDLTVMIGGHVDPRVTNVDLVRAFESIRGAGLELPIITTNITTLADPTAYPVLYLTGQSQINLFRLGFWPYGEGRDIEQRLNTVRRELMQIVTLGRRCGIAALFPNKAGAFVGEAVWDTQTIIADMDPRWVGFDFDPAHATAEGGAGGWETAMRLALPRVKAFSLQDFYWKKDGRDWKMQMCPMGEGMVDWKKFFALASAAKFTGPISIHMEYQPQDEPGAMARDLEFVREHVRDAWIPVQAGS
jgi:L-ribulose-5-phosphate 3-epimerase